MTTNKFPGVGYKRSGYAKNYFRRVSVFDTTFGGGSDDGYQPTIIIPFTTQCIMFLNEGTGVIEYSFDGREVHGESSSADLSKQLVFNNRVASLIWFRVKSGSSGPISFRVDAWSIP